jgi:Uncharacterized protein conserved in bacteria
MTESNEGEWVVKHVEFNGKNIKFTGHMKNGKREGRWTTWDAQGNLLAEGNYTAGEMDGRWVEWDENKKATIKYYKNGIPL